MKIKRCIYCQAICHKHGRDRNDEQRYKCTRKNCGRTSTGKTIVEVDSLKEKRVVLHLILSGCDIPAISERLKIEQSTVKRWSKLHLKGWAEIVVPEPLPIQYLLKIYNKLELKSTYKLVKRRMKAAKRSPRR